MITWTPRLRGETNEHQAVVRGLIDVYVYSDPNGQSWFASLGDDPDPLPLKAFALAEACAEAVVLARRATRKRREPQLALGRVAITGAYVAAAERGRTREMASLVVRLVGEIERLPTLDGMVLKRWVIDAKAYATALLGKAPARGRKRA